MPSKPFACKFSRLLQRALFFKKVRRTGYRLNNRT